MSEQISLIPDPVPALPLGIVLHCGDVSLVLAERGAKLVIADPPWLYTNTGGLDSGLNGAASASYECPSMPDICRVIDASYDSAADDAYLFCWTTWPMIADFLATLERQGNRWRYLTGGSWHKTGGLGIGFHVRGDSEPFLLFAKGKPKPVGTLSNAWASPRERHSEKPTGRPGEYTGLCALMEALTEPGALVLSIYSGLCPEARAAKLTGRKLVGAEIDPDRHQRALCLLAAAR